MRESDLEFLRCPVTGSTLQLRILKTTHKNYLTGEKIIISEGLLFSEKDWFYPVINGIPRLIVEAFLDYEDFLKLHLSDFLDRKRILLTKHQDLINEVVKKNLKTKKSFTLEWKSFNYEQDKTWEADGNEMLRRFFQETCETVNSIQGKFIFDAGCGNGLLDILLAAKGAKVLAMDFSLSIEKAFEENSFSNVCFIQGDVQFPPIKRETFDIVHCSGVLHHTSNTEQSFSKLCPYIKELGKLSVWLYHPRKDYIHNLFNLMRRFTSKLPLRFQYYFYLVAIAPPTFIGKRLKGNKQNYSEHMVAILDWFSPQFRWEHDHEEVKGWFMRYGFHSIAITTNNNFGFNITGIKKLAC